MKIFFFHDPHNKNWIAHRTLKQEDDIESLIRKQFEDPKVENEIENEVDVLFAF